MVEKRSFQFKFRSNLNTCDAFCTRKDAHPILVADEGELKKFNFLCKAQPVNHEISKGKST